LRDLARGIHPAILSEAGLGPALRALARESTIPTACDVEVPATLPEPVAAAAYFVAAEALTNVAKYAGATHATLTAAVNEDELRLEVTDDGRGGADPAAGSGLRGLDDRVAALGGRLEIHSPPGGGTRVTASLPLQHAPAERVEGPEAGALGSPQPQDLGITL
jgi:signal transduction histidine kinase